MKSGTGVRVATAALAITALMAGPARSQTAQEFVEAFSGAWKVFDTRYGAEGSACSLTLKRQPAGTLFALESAGCGGEMAGVKSWGIVENQLALLDQAGAVLIKLGGNQRRMTGTTSAGKPIIFDRVDTPGAGEMIEAAAQASGCYYLGFSTNCAGPVDLAGPQVRGEGATAQVKVLANLNVRAEARDDAPVLGVVPADACIAVQDCHLASDGVWCRAQFGQELGWLSKFTLRRDRWPVVTYTNGCTPNS